MDAIFTWLGSTDQNNLVELATINGQEVDQSTGYAGAIQLNANSFLQLLELPQSLGLPNNGFLDCYSPITFGAKNWSIRPDGTLMDGTKPGDIYMMTGTVSCLLFDSASDSDKTINIILTELRQIIQRRNCSRYGCRIVLVDVMKSGSGSASAV